jgi:hypothetical protein
MMQQSNRPWFKRYQYKGFWIESFIEPNFETGEFKWYASIELPRKQGCISGSLKATRVESELAAEELIDSWD